jgi:anti-sigma factor RsiW
MNHPKPELIGALLDHQLAGMQRGRVVRHIRTCSPCAQEYRLQRRVRRLIRENVASPQMSDSPDFFWSKVKAGIQARGDESFIAEPARLSFLDWIGTHRPVLASVAAGVVVVLGLFMATRSARVPPRNLDNSPVVQHASVSLPNTAVSIVGESEPDVTVIWVSGLPWTRDMTEQKTVYAHPHYYIGI